MKQISMNPTKIRAVFLAIAILALSFQGAFAQSNDFFSSTQSTDLRASATTPDAPGFDPCRGGTAGPNGSSCTGAPAGSQPLLDPINLVGLFPKLGPGAVTDNMFGTIERPVDPLDCNPAASFGSNLLNCGDGKWEPGLQGQTIPVGGNNLTQPMATNTPINMVSCSNPDPDTLASCAGDPSLHHSRMENAFVWNPSANPVTLPINLTGLPTIATAPAANSCAGNTPAQPRVCGQFFLHEITALSATSNVEVQQAASWTTLNDAAGAMLGNPTVVWESRIIQAEMIGGGVFDQTLQGQFVYNTTPAGSDTFPTTQYPNGQSMTLRSTGSGSVIEVIP